MTFQHKFIPRTELNAVTKPSGRVYETPDGDFPSVTTILGMASDESGLAAWRKRIGEDEAAVITGRAGTRGTAVHDIAERYVRNEPDWNQGVMPLNLMTFHAIKPLLDRNVGAVWGIEYPMWSKRLQTAGRTDLFCEWAGEPAIVDFKTSSKFRGEDSAITHKYLLQVATYATMVSELTGINTKKIVLLFCPDDHIAGISVVRDRTLFEEHVETIFAARNRERLLTRRSGSM